MTRISKNQESAILSLPFRAKLHTDPELAASSPLPFLKGGWDGVA